MPGGPRWYDVTLYLWRDGVRTDTSKVERVQGNTRASCERRAEARANSGFGGNTYWLARRPETVLVPKEQRPE